MYIFERRPLGAAVSIAMLMILLAHRLGTAVSVLTVIVLTAIACIVFGRRTDKTCCLLPVASFELLTALITLPLLLTHFIVCELAPSRFDNLAASGKSVPITATVVDVRNESSWSASYDIRIETLDGENIRADGLLSCDAMSGLMPGDLIACEVVFEPIDTVWADFAMNRHSLLASGVSFAAECDFVDTLGTKPTLASRICELRAEIIAAISVYLDSETAALVNALALAENGELGIMRRDFSRAGILHILALSGMHLSILCAVGDKLLELFGLRRRLRVVLLIGFIAFYTLLAGVPASLLRAAVMLTVMYVFTILGRDRDGISALFAAMWLILLFDPAAIYDLGLLMSFTATLGVLVIGGETSRMATRIRNKRLRSILGTLAASVGAVVFLVPIQYLYFGELSLVSIPATLLLGPVSELLLILILPYTISALVGMPYIASILALPITFLSDLMRITAEKFAATDSLLPLEYPFTRPLIVLCVAAIAVMSKKRIGNRLYMLIPFGICTGIFLFGTYLTPESDSIHAMRIGTNEAIVVISGEGECMVIDSSEGSSKLMRRLAGELNTVRAVEIDTFMLTHLHRSHVRSITTLCENKLVRRFLVPEPIGEDEEYIIADIRELADKFGASIELYPRPEKVKITFENAEITLAEPTKIKRSTHPIFALEIVLDQTTVAYMTGAYTECFEPPSADIIIQGTHGAKEKTESVYDQLPEKALSTLE